MAAGCAIVARPSCLGGFGTRTLGIIGGLFDETAHVEALERLLDSPSLRIEIGDKARQRAAFMTSSAV